MLGRGLRGWPEEKLQIRRRRPCGRRTGRKWRLPRAVGWSGAEEAEGLPMAKVRELRPSLMWRANAVWGRN